jgi:hypothetical protein
MECNLELYHYGGIEYAVLGCTDLSCKDHRVVVVVVGRSAPVVVRLQSLCQCGFGCCLFFIFPLCLGLLCFVSCLDAFSNLARCYYHRVGVFFWALKLSIFLAVVLLLCWMHSLPLALPRPLIEVTWLVIFWSTVLCIQMVSRGILDFVLLLLLSVE